MAILPRLVEGVFRAEGKKIFQPKEVTSKRAANCSSENSGSALLHGGYKLVERDSMQREPRLKHQAVSTIESGCTSNRSMRNNCHCSGWGRHMPITECSIEVGACLMDEDMQHDRYESAEFRVYRDAEQLHAQPYQFEIRLSPHSASSSLATKRSRDPTGQRRQIAKTAGQPNGKTVHMSVCAYIMLTGCRIATAQLVLWVLPD